MRRLRATTSKAVPATSVVGSSAPPPPLGGAVIVTSAESETLESAAETAETETVAGEGTLAGAR